MKLSEFTAFDKYPFAKEEIRKNISSLVLEADTTTEHIQNDPTLTSEAKTVKQYQEGVKKTEKIAKEISKSIKIREVEIEKASANLKSTQLKKAKITPEQSSLVSILYSEIKSGEMDIRSIESESALKIALSLSDAGMIEDITSMIDERYSSDEVQAIQNNKELISFEWELLENLREYEMQGLKENKALEIDKNIFKG